MSDVPIEPCRYCQQPKRIDTWCASDECAARVAIAQDEERHRLDLRQMPPLVERAVRSARERRFGSVAASVLGSGETE